MPNQPNHVTVLPRRAWWATFEPMKKPINRLFLAATGLLAVMFYLVVQPIASARPKWPRIPNQEALLSDTQRLAVEAEGRMIASNLWPTSVSMLKPRYVFRRADHLKITMSTRGIGPSWGYLVFPDKRISQQSSADVRILKLEGPGIYRYETVE